MPKLHHQNKSISPVKARAKIKVKRNLGPEILAVLADPKNHRNYAEFRWQERLSVLFAQPTRVFHGINLQDGINIIAFFVHWQNLEEYQQSFERIGSTRQA